MQLAAWERSQLVKEHLEGKDTEESIPLLLPCKDQNKTTSTSNITSGSKDITKDNDSKDDISVPVDTLDKTENKIFSENNDTNSDQTSNNRSENEYDSKENVDKLEDVVSEKGTVNETSNASAVSCLQNQESVDNASVNEDSNEQTFLNENKTNPLVSIPEELNNQERKEKENSEEEGQTQEEIQVNTNTDKPENAILKIDSKDNTSEPIENINKDQENAEGKEIQSSEPTAAGLDSEKEMNSPEYNITCNATALPDSTQKVETSDDEELIPINTNPNQQLDDFETNVTKEIQKIQKLQLINPENTLKENSATEQDNILERIQNKIASLVIPKNEDTPSIKVGSGSNDMPSTFNADAGSKEINEDIVERKDDEPLVNSSSELQLNNEKIENTINDDMSNQNETVKRDGQQVESKLDSGSGNVNENKISNQEAKEISNEETNIANQNPELNINNSEENNNSLKLNAVQNEPVSQELPGDKDIQVPDSENAPSTQSFAEPQLDEVKNSLTFKTLPIPQILNSQRSGIFPTYEPKIVTLPDLKTYGTNKETVENGTLFNKIKELLTKIENYQNIRNNINKPKEQEEIETQLKRYPKDTLENENIKSPTNENDFVKNSLKNQGNRIIRILFLGPSLVGKENSTMFKRDLRQINSKRDVLEETLQQFNESNPRLGELKSLDEDVTQRKVEDSSPGNKIITGTEDIDAEEINSDKLEEPKNKNSEEDQSDSATGKRESPNKSYFFPLGINSKVTSSPEPSLLDIPLVGKIIKTTPDNLEDIEEIENPSEQKLIKVLKLVSTMNNASTESDGEKLGADELNEQNNNETSAIMSQYKIDGPKSEKFKNETEENVNVTDSKDISESNQILGDIKCLKLQSSPEDRLPCHKRENKDILKDHQPSILSHFPPSICKGFSENRKLEPDEEKLGRRNSILEIPTKINDTIDSNEVDVEQPIKKEKQNEGSSEESEETCAKMSAVKPIKAVSCNKNKSAPHLAFLEAQTQALLNNLFFKQKGKCTDIDSEQENSNIFKNSNKKTHLAENQETPGKVLDKIINYNGSSNTENNPNTTDVDKEVEDMGETENMRFNIGDRLAEEKLSKVIQECGYGKNLGILVNDSFNNINASKKDLEGVKGPQDVNEDETILSSKELNSKLKNDSLILQRRKGFLEEDGKSNETLTSNNNSLSTPNTEFHVTNNSGSINTKNATSEVELLSNTILPLTKVKKADNGSIFNSLINGIASLLS